MIIFEIRFGILSELWNQHRIVSTVPGLIWIPHYRYIVLMISASFRRWLPEKSGPRNPACGWKLYSWSSCIWHTHTKQSSRIINLQPYTIKNRPQRLGYVAHCLPLFMVSQRHGIEPSSPTRSIAWNADTRQTTHRSSDPSVAFYFSMIGRTGRHRNEPIRSLCSVCSIRLWSSILNLESAW